MRIVRARHFTCNLGQFESYRFGAEIEITHRDLGYSDDHTVLAEDLAVEMTEVCLKILNDQLTQELEDAREITTEQKSFLLASFTTPSTRRKRQR